MGQNVFLNFLFLFWLQRKLPFIRMLLEGQGGEMHDSHHYDPGFIPTRDKRGVQVSYCSISIWLPGFLSEQSGFPPSTKPIHS